MLNKLGPKKTKKETRGGARVGAGAPGALRKHPQEVRVDFPIRLQKWMADKVDELRADTGHTRAEYVEVALASYYGMKQPKT